MSNTPSLKTEFHTMQELVDAHERGEKLEPLDISVIPNYMGINLGSVEGMSWTRQTADDQLVSLTIHFLPATAEQLEEQERAIAGGVE